MHWMNVKDPGHGWLIIGELWSWGRVVSFIIQKVNISIDIPFQNDHIKSEAKRKNRRWTD